VKRKTNRDDAPVVAKELLERARQALETEMDTFKRPVKCSVCGSECAPTPSDEQLCWVCRRLKISAWRDADVQMPAQE
jgi:hypothetical protein